MEFVSIQSYTNYVDAHIVMGQLEDEGICCWLKDENTVTTFPVWTNAVGGIKLMVSKGEEEQARQFLELLDISQKEKNSCPYCKSHNIEFVTTPRKPGNWFSVLIGLLLFSFALPVEKVYHCFNCGKEFEKPTEHESSE